MRCPDCKTKLRLHDFVLDVDHGQVEIKSVCPDCSRNDEYYIPDEYYFGIKN